MSHSRTLTAGGRREIGQLDEVSVLDFLSFLMAITIALRQMAGIRLWTPRD